MTDETPEGGSWFERLHNGRGLLSGDDRGSDADERQHEEERSTLGRRSFLAGTAVATAAIAGCAGGAPGSTELVNPVSLYGYGGIAVVEQPSSAQLTVTESEPNDTEDDATLVDFGATVQGDLGEAEVDWYAVEVTEGTQVTVDFQRSAASGVSAVILYDSTGDFANLRYVGTDDPVRFTETATATGTHYVEIVNVEQSGGSYTLIVGDGTDDTTTTATPTETATATPTPTPTDTPDDGQAPFGGQARSVPGRIQAQNFDTGGEGVAYNESDSENQYGTSYREGGVDIRETQDSSGRYNVGYFDENEWLEYTVDITQGTYDIHMRVATPLADRELRVLLGGVDLGSVVVTDTGGWRSWETVTIEDVTVETSGTQVLRVETVNSGIDFNWVEFDLLESTPTPTTTVTPTETTTVTTETATPEDDYGTQTYGEYGYGG